MTDYKKCKKCLANYPKEQKHICTPWIKALVKQHNKNNDQRIIKT